MNTFEITCKRDLKLTADFFPSSGGPKLALALAANVYGADMWYCIWIFENVLSWKLTRGD